MESMEIIWISWFPECGKIMEKIWNTCGKNRNTYRKHGIHKEKYRIHIEKIWNKCEQSLALVQATKHLQMPQDWVYCMLNYNKIIWSVVCCSRVPAS